VSSVAAVACGVAICEGIVAAGTGGIPVAAPGAGVGTWACTADDRQIAASTPVRAGTKSFKAG